MSNEADVLNAILKAEAPLVLECLSELGLRAAFPRGIPYQSGTARGTTFNATIGQVTDGHGSPLPIPEMSDAVAALDDSVTFCTHHNLDGRNCARYGRRVSVGTARQNHQSHRFRLLPMD